MDHYNMSKTDIYYFNERRNFVQVLFMLFMPGLNLIIDQKDLSQSFELFKCPFVVKMMNIKFNKWANVPYFIL